LRRRSLLKGRLKSSDPQRRKGGFQSRGGDINLQQKLETFLLAIVRMTLDGTNVPYKPIWNCHNEVLRTTNIS
jgi:hypothetical protein